MFEYTGGSSMDDLDIEVVTDPEYNVLFTAQRLGNCIVFRVPKGTYYTVEALDPQVALEVRRNLVNEAHSDLIEVTL